MKILNSKIIKRKPVVGDNWQTLVVGLDRERLAERAIPVLRELDRGDEVLDLGAETS